MISSIYFSFNTIKSDNFGLFFLLSHIIIEGINDFFWSVSSTSRSENILLWFSAVGIFNWNSALDGRQYRNNIRYTYIISLHDFGTIQGKCLLCDRPRLLLVRLATATWQSTRLSFAIAHSLKVCYQRRIRQNNAQ